MQAGFNEGVSLTLVLPKGRTLIVPFGGTLVMGDPMSFPAGTTVDAITEKAQSAIASMALELKNENRLPPTDSQ